MNRLLKKIAKASMYSMLFCGTLMSSQVAAAWGNESPWSKKHAERKRQAALEEVVLEAPVVQPEVQAEAEPVAVDPEPVAIPTEIVPVLEPEPVATRPVPMPVEEPVMDVQEEIEILSLPSSHYAVQVYASSSTDNMDKYKIVNGLEDLMAVKTRRNGSAVYVLVSVHEDRDSANEAASNLEQLLGTKPWVRSVSGLQAVVMQ